MAKDAKLIFCITFVCIHFILTHSVSPKITFSGLEEAPYKDNDTVTVTVTCAVDRLYPQIQPENFTMTWGDTVMEAEGVKNDAPEESYKYQVQMTKTLTKEDNGTTIICQINPVRGAPVSVERTLNRKYQPETVQDDSVKIDTRMISMNSPDVASQEYEEIEEPGYLVPIAWHTADNPEVVSNDTLNIETRMTSANEPDVASEEYEEIAELGYLVPTAQCATDPLDPFAEDHQYERLRKKTFDGWVKENNISSFTKKELFKNAISSVEDLKALTSNDILELGLNIGDRNRLKIALKKLQY